MPGNFYSEPLKDEVKRLRAELSRERALCAGLAEALEQIRGKARLGGDALGNSPPQFESCQLGFYMLAEIAGAALSELEESK